MQKMSEFAMIILVVFALSMLVTTPTSIQTAKCPGCPSECVSISDLDTDLSGVTVGLYQSYFSSTDDRVNVSRTALYNMFTWMNATIHVLNKTDILNGALWACEIFAVPEGLGPTIQLNLGMTAMDMIKEWIALGGSYIGVRGSSTIAVSDGIFEGSTEVYYMDLINGTSIGMASYGYIVMTELTIDRNLEDGPDLSGMNETMTMLWRTGRYFVADEGQELIYIANYTHSGEPAIVASRYGQGNVFISSPQFEIEEDSDRDGTEVFDAYEDPESDWPFVLEVCKWLVEDSTTVANTTTWTYPSLNTGLTDTTNNTDSSSFPVPIENLVLAGGVGAVVIIALILFLRKR